MTPLRSTFIDVRGLRYHLREWGAAGDPLLLMLHGWMDVSASFQFVVDALADHGGRWHVIAPDWRGYGLTQRSTGYPGTDGYWFADYLADLDRIVEHCSPSQPVHLIGHSMGGNIACCYAGVRPQRIASLTSLEGFGLPATKPEQAPHRYAQWLDALMQPEAMKSYASAHEVAVRLMKNNQRLQAEQAAFLAEHWARPNAEGRWEVQGDPAHKRIGPLLYRVDEMLACWRAITAPVLWLAGRQSDLFRLWTRGDATAAAAWRADHAQRMTAFKHLREIDIDDAGHMLHHDQPDAVARAIAAFIAGLAAEELAQ